MRIPKHHLCILISYPLVQVPSRLVYRSPHLPHTNSILTSILRLERLSTVTLALKPVQRP